MKKAYPTLLFLFLLNCSSPLQKVFDDDVLNSSLFKQNFIGLSVYDLAEKTYLIEYNDRKYFTPASNTKLFTYYAGKRLLGSLLPTVRYKELNDSLVIWGTGDPSLLHHDLQNDKLIEFLKSQQKKIYLSASNAQQKYFGLGWAWDDYSDYYSAELSAFPIYGNILKIRTDSVEQTLAFSPQEFAINSKRSEKLRAKSFNVKRDLKENNFKYNAIYPFVDDSIEVPFVTSDIQLRKILSHRIGKSVESTTYSDLNGSKELYSFPTDSMLKRMLQVSDNFLAEQSLMMLSNELFDSLDIRRTITYVKDSLLNFLSDQPRWVDASGLSRYNLFTPRSFVELLSDLYQRYEYTSLFSSLAIGGKAGTLKKRFISDKPFIYGKTGTLSNNHNLSGYLIAKSGKVYAFSFMMNHYRNSTSKMKKQMDKVLFRLRDEL